MTRKTIVGVSVLAMTAVLCPPTWAGWTVTSMKPAGSEASQVFGLSGGCLVGRVATPDTVYHAAMWVGESNQWLDLNPSGHYYSSVNAASGNHQVGEARDDDNLLEHAVLWSGTAGSMVDLHPGPGMSYSSARAVYGDKQAGCAGGDSTDKFMHAGVWSGTAASWHDLNTAEMIMSEAFGVYGDSIVGWATRWSTGERHATVWDSATGSWTDLTPEGPCGSAALGVWEDTQVGYADWQSNGDSSDRRAAMWTGTADSWVDLNPQDAMSSQASAVCEGWQVGFFEGETTYGQSHASIWSGTAESCFDLHSLLSEDFYESEATGVQVMGSEVWVSGWARERWDTQAFLWHYTPDAVPEPSSLLALLCGVGTLGTVVRRRKS